MSELSPGVMEGFGSCLVMLGEVQGDLVNAGGKRRGAQDVGVDAPAQDPAFNFFEAAEAQLHLRAAAGEFPHGLRRMTDAWCSVLGLHHLAFDMRLLHGDFKNHRLAFGKQ